jgi:hypothetical protein
MRIIVPCSDSELYRVPVLIVFSPKSKLGRKDAESFRRERALSFVAT